MVIVKVFHGHDIKRFVIGKRGDFSHQSLMNLLRDNFPSITEDHCFKYFDSEGDLCTLTKSTFEDCFAPMTSKSGEAQSIKVMNPQSQSTESPPETITEETEEEPIIRLFVCEKVAVPTCDPETLISQSPLQAESDEISKEFIVPAVSGGRSDIKEIHPGITCDCCDMTPISGPRYNCQECADFDLCQGCYDSPMSPSVLEHVSNHAFVQMSSLDTLRSRKRRMGGGIKIPFRTEILTTERAPETAPETMTSPLSPRTGAEWTEVSIGAPHVEGLLRAFGVDVDSAKEAVNKFITTGDFRDILKHVGGPHGRDIGIETATSTGS